jgi:hypothetical protein
MEIDLRIPDDYCQGGAETLYTEFEEEYEEDLKVRRFTGFKITPRNRLTRTN